MLSNTLLSAASRCLMAEPSRATAFLKRLEAYSQPSSAGLLDSLLASFSAPAMTIEDGVAVIPFKGFTGYHLSTLEKAIGMQDVEEFTANLQAAYDNPEVKAIMLDVDSPGGFVVGVEEASDLVASSPKPIESWGTSIHSAATFVTGVAHRVTGMASGDYGSVGTVMVVEDLSGMAEKEGIKVHVISSGWAKGMLTPGAPVTDQQLSYLKEDVIMDEANAFRSKLKAVRTSIPDEALQGQFYSGRKAATLGFLTGIGSRKSVLNRLKAI